MINSFTRIYLILFFIFFLFPQFVFSQTQQQITETENTIPVLIKKIRKALPHLQDSGTALVDSYGNNICLDASVEEGKIALNCAGFAKYLADGFYAPLRKDQGFFRSIYLSPQELRIRFFDLRGDNFTSQFEWTRDPYFALDWTRNIASQLGTIREDGFSGHEAHDITSNAAFPYLEDKGYPAKYLVKVLKPLVKKNPERWYLASMNDWYGKEPELWQHHHIICLFPFYDDAGKFQLVIFERCRETSIENFLIRYPDSFLHLVWLDGTGKFELK